MLLVGTKEAAQDNRKQGMLFNGTRYWRNDYFTTPSDEAYSPQAYLVEQFPGSVNPTHFHVQNQFQVFTRGSGTIGRHAIEPCSVHYAGSYTGYGPITAGDEGIDYITLRSFKDPGAKFVPQQRDELRMGPKRHYSSPKLDLLAESDLQALTDVQVHTVHPADPDGLSVFQMRLPASSSAEVSLAAGAVSMYLGVLQGAITHESRTLGRLENLFVSRDAAPYTLTTGSQSAEVLVLQFPAQDPAYA